MAAKDLTAPLGMGKRKLIRLPFGLIGMGLMTVVITTGLLWMGVVDDPLGGEPTAVVPLERTVEGLAARDIAALSVQQDLSSDEDGRAGKQHATLGPRFDDEANQPSRIGEGLSVTPDQRVTERVEYGYLPKVGGDGIRPLDLYARPLSGDLLSAPRIAVVIGGIGLSEAGSQNALKSLPPEVTLAIAPYAATPDRWMKQARAAGHELLMQLPLEPFDYPDNDPGPHTLLVSLRSPEFLDRLSWLLSRTTNYAGVINTQGGRFTAAEPSMQLLLEQVTQRGLMYVDDGSSSRTVAPAAASAARTPFSRVDVVLDAVPRAEDINGQLLQLEALARARGVAVASGTALPVTIKTLQEWAADLERRGLQLVPVSATIDRAPQG
ncbi:MULTISPECIES: divergent polysaccharide deacetylase family protein [Pannonibacter]|nr:MULTISPECIES: divergent polysaccharide deacetylase family protein [Pannonibacter]